MATVHHEVPTSRLDPTGDDFPEDPDPTTGAVVVDGAGLAQE